MYMYQYRTDQGGYISITNHIDLLISQRVRGNDGRLLDDIFVLDEPNDML